MARPRLGLRQSCGNLGPNRGITRQRLHPSPIASSQSCHLEGVWGTQPSSTLGAWGAAPQAEEVGFNQSRVQSQDLCVQGSPGEGS
ncbi:MAG: hypothetical protein NW220_13965 [Leptolyngbyaceae cyanobacterium bins.349]|nr:hypothetical protein [Leptolyngbyaceae cyanobacterium bins.349]